jgi:hypothetical protein
VRCVQPLGYVLKPLPSVYGSGALYLQCYSKDSPDLGCFPLETHLFFIFDSQDACVIEGQEGRDKMGVAGIRYA